MWSAREVQSDDRQPTLAAASVFDTSYAAPGAAS